MNMIPHRSFLCTRHLRHKAMDYTVLLFQQAEELQVENDIRNRATEATGSSCLLQAM